MNMVEHILVVDDEPGLRKLLTRYLEKEGYRVSAAADGQAMWEILKKEPADLIILDLVMPGEDGLTLTRRLREKTNAAVIILTLKSEAVDRVVGLEMGADDYVTKPFHMRELHARIKSVLRRVPPAPGQTDAGSATAQESAPDMAYLFAGWRLDVVNRDLIAPDGSDMPLTKGEYALLMFFLNNPGRLLNRDELTIGAWNKQWSPFDRGIDVAVGRLRKKLERAPQSGTDGAPLIKTVRGGGYLFVPEVNQEPVHRNA